MASGHEAAVARIRKLMEHANCEGSTEAEMESYLSKARKMMDELGITEDVVLSAQDEESKRRQDAETTDESVVSRVGAVPMFFRRTAQAVCYVTDTAIYTSTREETKPDGTVVRNKHGQARRREHIVFYGLKRDVAVAKELYAELHASIHAMAWMRCGKAGWSSSHMSYAMGFADKLCSRASALRYESKDAQEAAANVAGANGGFAIILAKDAILARKRQALGLVSRGKARATKIGDSSAYGQGQSDGAAVSLGTNGISGKAQARVA